MSARNIRAHQTRGLLPSPIRHGRSAYYGPVHLRRLRHITTLQKQGFNLVSIAAMLKSAPVVESATVDTGGDRPAAAIADIAREQPSVVRCLERHGVLVRDDAGTPAVVRPSVSRAMADLAGAGVPPAVALRLLGRFLDGVAPLAGEQLAALEAQTGAGSEAPRACFAELLVSAFKMLIENAAEATFPDGETEKWRRR